MSALSLPLVDQSGWEASRINNLPDAAVVTTRSVKSNICSYRDTRRSTSTLSDEGSAKPEAYLTLSENSGVAAKITEPEGQKEADVTPVMESADRTANPPAEGSIITKTFYNKSFHKTNKRTVSSIPKDIRLPGEKDNINVLDNNPESIVVPPSHDRTTRGRNTLPCRWAAVQILQHTLSERQSFCKTSKALASNQDLSNQMFAMPEDGRISLNCLSLSQMQRCYADGDGRVSM
ncbi:hypothetical protein chiPu_0017535 [Chiloscyllium punctatum]|uniref:Uncharacterized protein n=1 Tax=Chiloscyllium punctatum TaxID=137246 RepID=A0A401RGS9_CHIPU|nr:hypothetical protein [Chiloscyllium punctatum]